MEHFIKIIKEDKEVNEFINTLTKEEIEMNICLLLEQVKANAICNKCQGKKECLSDVNGMRSYLIKNTSFVTREYFDCNYLNKVASDGLELIHFPSGMFSGKMFLNENRSEIIKTIEKYKKSDGTKGIYLYGPFGSGKTYLLYNLANNLATKRNKKVIFAYYPDLVREAKSSIANNSLEKLIIKLKNIDVLMLDDFGAEVNTSFIRDEFLGPILQYRMMMNLPVFMTSNFDIRSLKGHLSETKDETDELKASRIIERIEHMMSVVQLNDDNYRKK